MAKESIEVSTVLPIPPVQAYAAWLDSATHSAFTGATAKISPVVGGRHTAWGGYIEGENRELEPGKRVLQTWRTSEFAGSDEDSLLELLLTPEGGGTRLLFRHSNIPEGQGRYYEQGWKDHYFTPMLAWCETLKDKPVVVVAAKKSVARKTAAKKGVVKKAPAKKAVVKKAVVKKAPAKKSKIIKAKGKAKKSRK